MGFGGGSDEAWCETSAAVMVQRREYGPFLKEDDARRRRRERKHLKDMKVDTAVETI